MRQGSVIADWKVDLEASESFKATVTVAKQVAASVLEQFTAPTTIAATPTPKPVEEQPTEAPTAIAATPTPIPAAQAGGIDFGLIGGILLLVLIAGGAYLYYQKSKAAQ